MTTLTLQGLTPKHLAALGDGAMKAGDVMMARGIYRHLLATAPSPQAHARYGLTFRPNARTQVMLVVIQALEGAIPGADIFVGEGIATWLKTPAFASDARFMTLAASETEIAPSGIANWHWNLATVLWAAQQTLDLPGDFVELGVYKGHTTRFLAEYLDFGAKPKRWWLYDTFEGVPSDQADKGREGMTAAVYGAAFSFEEVRDRFAPYGNINVIKGRVPECFADTCPDLISFLHVDLNNSTAEIAALDTLYDRLTPGGVIVFDDFQWSSSRAQFKAETEWFKSRGLAVLPLPTGQGVFVKPLA